MSSRLKNGRFVRKKLGNRIGKALAGMSEAKKTKRTQHDTTHREIPDENCIVALRKLVKNLKCSSCRSLLDMEKLYEFEREGLHVEFKIKCDSCARCNVVHTGESSGGVCDINTCKILGTIHAGVSNTDLSKILACANLPQINDNIYKMHEVIIDKAIKSEVEESCERAVSEEKELVIKNEVYVTPCNYSF